MKSIAVATVAAAVVVYNYSSIYLQGVSTTYLTNDFNVGNNNKYEALVIFISFFLFNWHVILYITVHMN